MKTNAIAPIVVEILLCLVFFNETQKIETDSGIKLLEKPNRNGLLLLEKFWLLYRKELTAPRNKR
jgi:hypothetical protein